MSINALSARPHAALKPSPKAAAQTGSDVVFNYNSQDSTVFAPSTTTIHDITGGSAPGNKMVKLNSPLAANSDGTYNFKSGTPQEVAANAFASSAHTVDLFGKALGQPISWAFGSAPLGVNADAGEDFNAYYQRQDGSINFFHDTDPKTNQVIFSGDSGEVVSHETGHAILDSLRPAYFSSFTPDVAAFHESFGDMMGICMSLQDPRVIDNLATVNGGDMSKPNIVAATGEQLGAAINDSQGSNVTGGDWVRNAENNFKWADPSTLDQSGDANTLGSEAHSFSRLWTGAFYDVINAINKENLAANPGNPKAALQATGAEAIKLLAELAKGSPQGDFTYRDMANAWISADKANDGGKRADLITQVMTDRGILGGSAPSPSQGGDQDGGPFDNHMSVEQHPALNEFTFTKDGMKPLGSLTHGVTVTLGSNVPEAFRGAKVTTLVDNDGALAKDADVANRTKQSVANLIQNGRILEVPFGKKMTTKDYFDKTGEPYAGVLVTNADGSKSIERVKIAT